MAGYTTRVATMVQVFEDCSVGKYERQVVKSVKGLKNNLKKDEFQLEFCNGRPVAKGTVIESTDGTIILEKVKKHTHVLFGWFIFIARRVKLAIAMLLFLTTLVVSSLFLLMWKLILMVENVGTNCDTKLWYR